MPVIKTTRITKSTVDRVQPGEVFKDSELRGFGVRRQQGSAVYFLRKKIKGRDRWLIIGPHGAPWTPESARREAQRLIGLIATGVDPSAILKAKLENPTIAAVAPAFMADHGPHLKPTTQEKYDILFRLHIVPKLGHHRADELTRPEIQKFHVSLADKPSTANYCVAMLSKLMNWCEERGLRQEQSNPCRAIKKFRETKRHRYLSRDEFGRLGAALNDHAARGGESIFVVAAIRLLILTGARVGEILNLEWSHVDFERGLLLLPDSKTGQKIIRLNPQAADILQSVPRVSGNPYVIIGRREGARLINLQKPWRRIRAAANIDDVRLHDLRHSFASVAAAAKGSLPLIGKLLGHNHTQTTARYAHLTDDAVASLNDQVGATIVASLNPVGS